ncbi:MAG: hypothetical protein C0478_09085 [Planctomyces sp.]|nr:hypothetical protein [Planctomyces sp.]
MTVRSAQGPQKGEPARQPRLDWPSLIIRWVCLLWLGMMAATWPLWWGQHEFPTIPYMPLIESVSPLVDPLATFTLLVGLLTGMVFPARKNWWCIPVLCGVCWLVLGSQQRLQPWVWHGGLIVLSWQLFPPRMASRWWLVILVTIYVCSGISKLDLAFAHELGPTLLGGLLQSLGLGAMTRLWSPTIWHTLSLALPAGELLVGLFVAIPRTRTIGLILAIIMHSLLISTLGPWGLNHSGGVILWNISCAGIAFGLLAQHRQLPRSIPQSESLTPNAGGLRTTPQPPPPVPALARQLVMGSLLWLPAPLVLFDLGAPWTAWAVYSMRSEKVSLYLAEDDLQKLPPSLQKWVEPKLPEGPCADLDHLYRLRLDQWSLATLHTPIPPQGSFTRSVLHEVSQRYSLDSPLIVSGSPPSRLTGARRWNCESTRESTASL